MKHLNVLLTAATLLVSSNVLASGTKQPDPNQTQNKNPIYTADSGTKQPDPAETNGRGLVIIADSGTKQPDPNGRAIAKDSGYPTLMALLGKYFSF